ncbi:MAG: hypothetical protein QG555_221, partial [Thermodesulfobacteriota bacterium]|nr:hypothetical protein [Thermodesulfobacteriota bacterium]
PGQSSAESGRDDDPLLTGLIEGNEDRGAGRVAVPVQICIESFRRDTEVGGDAVEDMDVRLMTEETFHIIQIYAPGGNDLPDYLGPLVKGER